VLRVRCALAYLLTDCLAACSRVLLENLSVFLPVKKFTHFVGLKFCYRIHKCPPPIPILSQLDPLHTQHTNSCISVLILSSNLRPVSQEFFFPSGLPTKNPVYVSPLPHIHCVVNTVARNRSSTKLSEDRHEGEKVLGVGGF